MNTRGLAEGALMVAITIALFWFGWFLPLGDMIVGFLCPIPILLLVVRQGLRTALVALMAAGLLTVFTVGPMQGTLALLGYGPVGIAMGLAARRKEPAVGILLWGSAATLIATIMAVLLSQVFIKVDIVKEMADAASQAAKTMRDLHVPFPPQQEKLLIEIAGSILPAVLALSSLVLTFMNYLVANWFLRRLGTPLPELPPFGFFRAPNACAWGLILGFILSSLPRKFAFQAQIGWNLLFFFGYWFLVQGVAVIAFLLHRYAVPRPARVIVLFFMLGFFQWIPLIGLMDTWLDLRKLNVTEKRIVPT
ncbi:MAG: YybS family protein [Armatimonadetes bacterium]|nr:YybS family protein [Armatimonadota bacterium]